MKYLLQEIIKGYGNNYPLEDLVKTICIHGKARFSQQSVNGKMRYWFEFSQGKEEVTIGASGTIEEAVVDYFHNFMQY